MEHVFTPPHVYQFQVVVQGISRECFTYVYNFIDHWVCDLRLEAMLPLDLGCHYPGLHQDSCKSGHRSDIARVSC